jgi:hypothetical protein
MGDVAVYEVGDQLLYIDMIFMEDDLPMDAIERKAEVMEVEESGIVHIRYGDGVTDWFFPEQVMDKFERVTWDTMTS